MNNKELLEAIYDILAQNEVTPEQRAEVLARIDSMDYDDLTISFDHNGSDSMLTLRLTD